MRVVVAGATPLHYLILIAAVQVLPRLFEKIHVPIEVREELSCPATPPLISANVVARFAHNSRTFPAVYGAAGDDLDRAINTIKKL